MLWYPNNTLVDRVISCCHLTFNITLLAHIISSGTLLAISNLFSIGSRWFGHEERYNHVGIIVLSLCAPRPTIYAFLFMTNMTPLCLLCIRCDNFQKTQRHDQWDGVRYSCLGFEAVFIMYNTVTLYVTLFDKLITPSVVIEQFTQWCLHYGYVIWGFVRRNIINLSCRAGGLWMTAGRDRIGLYRFCFLFVLHSPNTTSGTDKDLEPCNRSINIFARQW